MLRDARFDGSKFRPLRLLQLCKAATSGRAPPAATGGGFTALLEVAVVQEPESISKSECTAKGREERGDHVRADHDLVIGLEEHVGLRAVEDLVQVDTDEDFLIGPKPADDVGAG